MTKMNISGIDVKIHGPAPGNKEVYGIMREVVSVGYEFEHKGKRYGDIIQTVEPDDADEWAESAVRHYATKQIDELKGV